MLDMAIEAAKKAGDVLARYFEMTGLEREIKDDKSFVSKADKESEAAIADIVRKEFPDHGLLGEEGSDVNPNAEYLWVVDPLDGTANFLNGIPIFGVSIGILKAGEPHIGVIYNPVTNSLYAGERGKGATYNGKPIRVSGQDAKEGLMTAGYSRKDKERAMRIVGASPAFFKSARVLGSCALELAYVARGGTEGFLCLGLSKWDYAAGALLVLEAGGRVSGLDGSPWHIGQNYFAASNGVAHEALLRLAENV
jgi:myo-inositol-1(or 4)-monophosphatase